MKKSLALEMLKSQAFDNFLATKFQSVKRYGGEGAEAMMGFFTQLFHQSQQCNISDIVIAEVKLKYFVNINQLVIFRLTEVV